MFDYNNDHADLVFFFFQAEDGIRDLVRSRGLGDVYKRQGMDMPGRLGGNSVMRIPFMIASRSLIF